MKLLIIDNYDSFTYNLVHLIKFVGHQDISIFRNDKIELSKVEEYDKILISPGPGIPNEAGITKALIEKYAPTKSILGICLGHQAITEVFGGSLDNLETVLHGISSQNTILEEDYLFKNVPKEFKVGHYHSWVSNKNLPEGIISTSRDERGNIMSLSNKKYDVKGLQFHPESILTEFGKEIMKNWIEH